MSEKPVLVHFTYTWISSGVSGFLANITGELAGEFTQTIVVWEDKGSVFDEQIRSQGIRIVSLCRGRSRGILDLPAAEEAFRKYLEKGPADIVHLHCSTSSELRFLRAAETAGVPARIAHCHNAGFEGGSISRFLKNRIHEIDRKRLSDAPTLRLACAEDAGKWLFGDETAFEVISNPVDTDRYLYSEEKRASFREKHCIGGDYAVCCTGRLSEQKNQAVLIEAFARFARNHNDSYLILAGDGNLRKALEDLAAQHGIGHRVLFLGTVSDVGEVLSAADGYALPSRFEGFGTAVLEAQANGLPCLLSDAVSPDADIMKNAVWVPANAPVSRWIDGLEELYQRTRCNGETVIRNSGYSKEKTAERLAEVYRKALG